MRDDMFKRALGARANAYAPYSGFAVGCCIRAESGKLYDGCNVENAAYPQGQCAEAAALGAMIASGDRRVVEVVVVGGGAELCTPCGGCRQRIREFADADVPVHVCGPEGLRRTLKLGDLLPLSFGSGNLAR